MTQGSHTKKANKKANARRKPGFKDTIPELVSRPVTEKEYSRLTLYSFYSLAVMASKYNFGDGRLEERLRILGIPESMDVIIPVGKERSPLIDEKEGLSFKDLRDIDEQLVNHREEARMVAEKKAQDPRYSIVECNPIADTMEAIVKEFPAERRIRARVTDMVVHRKGKRSIFSTLSAEGFDRDEVESVLNVVTKENDELGNYERSMVEYGLSILRRSRYKKMKNEHQRRELFITAMLQRGYEMEDIDFLAQDEPFFSEFGFTMNKDIGLH